MLCIGFAIQSLGSSGPVSGFTGPVAMIVIFFIYVWMTIKIFNISLKVISEISTGIMKWIGGGHTGFGGDDASHEGHSFISGVMNKGEGAAQAAQGAAKGGKETARAEEKHKELVGAQQANTEAMNGLSGKLIGKSTAEPNAPAETPAPKAGPKSTR